eukprot:365574-Chlamydomonas_euryale.AAC.19
MVNEAGTCRCQDATRLSSEAWEVALRVSSLRWRAHLGYGSFQTPHMQSDWLIICLYDCILTTDNRAVAETPMGDASQQQEQVWLSFWVLGWDFPRLGVPPGRNTPHHYTTGSSSNEHPEYVSEVKRASGILAQRVRQGGEGFQPSPIQHSRSSMSESMVEVGDGGDRPRSRRWPYCPGPKIRGNSSLIHAAHLNFNSRRAWSPSPSQHALHNIHIRSKTPSLTSTNPLNPL